MRREVSIVGEHGERFYHPCLMYLFTHLISSSVFVFSRNLLRIPLSLRSSGRRKPMFACVCVVYFCLRAFPVSKRRTVVNGSVTMVTSRDDVSHLWRTTCQIRVVDSRQHTFKHGASVCVFLV